MREATLAAVRFPDQLTLRAGRGPSRVLQLVDDPVVARLRDGDATLGWAGDSRLALYVDVPEGCWSLWRFEHNAELEPVHTWTFEQFGSADIVPGIILWLRRHDVRDGFDPFLHVVARNATVEAEKAAVGAEAVTEAVDRLGHGLRKDGAA